MFKRGCEKTVRIKKEDFQYTLVVENPLFVVKFICYEKQYHNLFYTKTRHFANVYFRFS
ncbi:hypothetical protein SAMN02745158_02837 [Lactonifactor longoviformis DSM 17459]|uniref:Uncharacterized protein n=1 Tax=Lactonifactor longoviformis DSM 17459 TaxID=1122155 RepID=A0A1M4ZLK0_9CLOT|nr:hypothetical protein SAMN02745158_02837 [Lactonifactor longoviformis DSM 17459]